MPAPDQTPLQFLARKFKGWTEQLLLDLFGKPKTQSGKQRLARLREEEPKKHILVIRLGALGDIVLCFQAFHEIRKAHADCDIALLTQPSYADFASRMPWFDRVITDPRPPATDINAWLKLRKDVRGIQALRIYDLQCKPRQAILFALIGGPLGPQWSGAAPFCSHPRLAEPSQGMHFIEYVAAQLQLANVPTAGPPDVSWFDDPLDGFKLPEKFVVLVPGGAAHRQYKRWPARNYAELAKKLKSDYGLTSIIIGTDQDADAVATLRSFNPDVLDFTGRTTPMQLAGLARRAVCVVANDTGPMHVAAAVGAPTLGLMSEQVNAKWSAPRGANAKWLQGKPLSDLEVGKVFLALREFLDQKS